LPDKGVEFSLVNHRRSPRKMMNVEMPPRMPTVIGGWSAPLSWSDATSFRV